MTYGVDSDVHLADLWESVARRVPDSVALIDPDGSETWSSFDRRADQFGGALLELGVRPGSSVGIALQNSKPYVEAFYGAIKVGAVPVHVNYRYLAGELEYLLRDGDIEVLVCESAMSETVVPAIERSPSVRHTVVIETDATGAADLPRSIEYESLLAGATPAARPTRRDPGQFHIAYTGGTTGAPKGVMQPLGGITARHLWVRDRLYGIPPALLDGAPEEVVIRLRETGDAPIVLVSCPLMHGTGRSFGLASLSAGGGVVLLPRGTFDASQCLAAAVAERATTIVIVGDAIGTALADALDEQPTLRSQPSLRTIVSAGAAWSANVKRRLLDRLGPELVLIDNCGSSEGAWIGLSAVRQGDELSTSRFEPAPGTIVLDEQLAEITPGAGVPGRIACRTTSLGYRNDPERSSATFVDMQQGRFALTGDWAVLESNGDVTLLGRGDMVVNTGGEKVFTDEVNSVILDLPGVADSVVIGMPDPRFGSVVTAAVVRAPDSTISSDEVIAHVRRRLAHYKAPKAVHFVDDLERGPNGKVHMPSLRVRLEALDKAAAS